MSGMTRKHTDPPPSFIYNHTYLPGEDQKGVENEISNSEPIGDHEGTMKTMKNKRDMEDYEGTKKQSYCTYGRCRGLYISNLF